MRIVTKEQAGKIASAMLRDVICRHCHARPANVDRIRKAFNRQALDWVAASRKEKTRR